MWSCTIKDNELFIQTYQENSFKCYEALKARSVQGVQIRTGSFDKGACVFLVIMAKSPLRILSSLAAI